MSEMKKLLESLDKLQECPPMEGGAMPPAPMDQGTPVSVNVSMNASGKEHVEDLLRMMQQAGLGGAQEVQPQMMPVRQDMERLRAIVGEPEMEADKAYADSIEEGEDNYPHLTNFEELYGIQDEELYKDMADDAQAMDIDEFEDTYSNVIDMAGEFWEDHQEDVDEGYANEPDEEYSDHEKMTRDLSGGINREKKAYAAAQRGDNAMAVEAIKAQLMAALEEKKAKPDFPDLDNDGDEEEPMKKAIKDKKAKKTDEGIISTVKKAYQDAKKEKERNAYHNKLAGDALKRMEPKELKPYYDAMRDKKKKK